MALTGLFEDVRPSLEGAGSVFVFDALISATHGVEFEWTSEPTELGSTISDNRWKRPRELTITAIVSSAEATIFDRNAHVKAWLRLRTLALQEPAVLFTIATTLESLDKMGIVSISVPQDASTGTSMTATIVARQIDVTRVGVAENLADAAQDGGLAEEDLGNQGFAAAA